MAEAGARAVAHWADKGGLAVCSRDEVMHQHVGSGAQIRVALFVHVGEAAGAPDERALGTAKRAGERATPRSDTLTREGGGI
eukprot:scaffold6282_cov119-Isochrysis_galbana.AAC.3